MRGKKEVYSKIISGDFLLAPPEKKKKALCWVSGVVLVLEKVDEEMFYAGWCLHHAKDSDDVYCGWLYCTKKRASCDINRHFNTSSTALNSILTQKMPS